MPSSMINSAMSGLSAAQVALSTASNNISNANTSGYNRQSAVLSQANSTLVGNSYVGNGVSVNNVQREYDAFIANQLRAAQTQNSGLTTQYQQMSRIDDMLSDTSNSLAKTMQDFFSSLQTVASDAQDPAARQAVLGKADGLVNQFKTADQYLRDQDKQINLAVSSSVDQINTYAKQIATLNDQISRLKGVGGGAAPNDLLDQRDQLVNQLNQVVGVEVSVQDGGTYNITVGNGINLVQGNTANQLAAVNASADPSRMTVAYVDPVAGNVEIPESQLKSGSLSGVLTFRTEDLDSARNRLGQLAQSFANAFNTQHSQGYDANGDPGTDLFTIGGPNVLSNSKNTGNAQLTPTIADSTGVQASDYHVQFVNNAWQVTRLSDNATLNPGTTTDASGNTSLNFDGMKIGVNGVPAAMDSFTVKPVANAVANMSLAINDEAKLALASDSTAGKSDNRNAQALLGLQNAKQIEGNKTFNDAYATLVSDVGNKTASLKVNSDTQTNVVTQLTQQQQSISGVNLDEEYGNLQRYQQYYLANAKVLEAASSLFDAIINIR